MKVFLSWSGARSREVASLLSDWLCCVIQATRPWISSRDLDRGSLWFGEISDQLKENSVGIICLTNENKTRPWILFEAGALAKGLSTSRVCTFLIDLETKDIEDPLAQFNHTFPTRESMLGLVRTLNSTLGTSGLDVRVLEQVFDTYWPQFEKGLASALARTEPSAPSKPRPQVDVMAEILENTRLLASRIRRLEGEIERAQDRRSRDPEPELPALRSRVYSALLEGRKPSEVLREFSQQGFPGPMVADYIDRFMAERAGNKIYSTAHALSPRSESPTT